MQEYLVNRLRIDSINTLHHADNEAHIQHPGFKGRLREILISNVLEPWLPPYVSCGTGMIIADEDVSRESTQDDVIIFDRSLVPPILAGPRTPEGVFLFNSVLLRIEVKSILDEDGLRRFVRSSNEIAKMKFTVWPGFDRNLMGPMNMLFAYRPKTQGTGKPDYHLGRMLQLMQEEGVETETGIVSALCVPGFGLWKIAKQDTQVYWQRLLSTNPEDHLAWFVAVVSNTCFQQHTVRQGREPSSSLEAGIGMYFPGGDDIWGRCNLE